MSVENPSDKFPTLPNTAESTLEKDLMSVMNVGKLSGANQLLFGTGELMQPKSVVHVMNVGNFSHTAVIWLNTGRFTLEQGLLGVMRMGNPLAKETHPTNITKLILQKSLMCVAIVGKHSFINLGLYDTRDLTLGRNRSSAKNVGNFFKKAMVLCNTRSFILD